MPEGNPRLKVAVAGGSIAGLGAAAALRCIGCEVDIYERTPGAMTSRGAGIAVQDELMRLLRRLRAARALPVVTCAQRRYLLPDGGDGMATSLPWRFTSWDAIFRTFRAAFPNTHYHPGSTLVGFRQADGRVVARFAGRGEVEVDLLICADGSRSGFRHWLLPQVEPTYAGYVALRGTLDESRVDPGLASFFDQSFTVCEARFGGHILAYLIPGPDDATEAGCRRLNWVWYVATPEGSRLDRLLTDSTGELHAGSVPAGMMPAQLVAEVHATAARELHPRFAELVGATLDPFVQVIVDVAVPRMVFGRACLLGDAAFVLRPHAGAATAKAAADATDLADALAADPSDLDAALRTWEVRRLARGRWLLEHGIALGARTVRPPDTANHPREGRLREAAERFRALAQMPRQE
jgi:2-polyprenyl-6-methoxyphenol hydroxylase-like FAD-dependent oxidoreductase